MDKLITTRKYAGKEYTFMLKTSVSVYNGNLTKYIVCYTPENALGYPDIVMLDASNKPYTAYRYLPNWILSKIQDVILRLERKYITKTL